LRLRWAVAESGIGVIATPARKSDDARCQRICGRYLPRLWHFDVPARLLVVWIRRLF
jgi:hypothetical protein